MTKYYYDIYTHHHTVSDLILYVSSFISKYNDQNENLDDLNTGKPSMLKIKDVIWICKESSVNMLLIQAAAVQINKPLPICVHCITLLNGVIHSFS